MMIYLLYQAIYYGLCFGGIEAIAQVRLFTNRPLGLFNPLRRLQMLLDLY